MGCHCRISTSLKRIDSKLISVLVLKNIPIAVSGFLRVTQISPSVPMNSPDCATSCGSYSLCFLSLQEERRDNEGFQSIFLSATERFESQKLINFPQQKLREWCFGLISCPVLPGANLTPEALEELSPTLRTAEGEGRQPDTAYSTFNSPEINLCCSSKPLAAFQLGELRADPGIQKEFWKVLWNASSGSITSCHKNHSKINDITEKRQKSMLFLYISFLSHQKKKNEDVSYGFWVQPRAWEFRSPHHEFEGNFVGK